MVAMNIFSLLFQITNVKFSLGYQFFESLFQFKLPIIKVVNVMGSLSLLIDIDQSLKPLAVTIQLKLPLNH